MTKIWYLLGLAWRRLSLYHCDTFYVTRGPLSYAHYRRDMIDLLGRHCIACVLWIILDFPAIERPWAQSLLQLPETFACVTQ